MEKIFSEFTQADETTTRKYGGTGLGLPISRHFCRYMGGDIVVESEVAIGSTFFARFPVIVEKKTNLPIILDDDEVLSTQETLALIENAPTVLLIDDDKTVHDILTRQLNREGFNVINAHNAETGLASARDRQPDIILLDVMMPETDGWSVLSTLKNDDDLSDIPVVMLSMVKNKSLGLSLGASDYLTKPVSREKLTGVLWRYIPNKESNNYDILIVEDDEDTRDLFAKTVEKEGWQARTADNGKTGLEAVSEKKPDLILLDIMMPEVDGIEFLTQLRARAEWQSVVVIAVTAKILTNEEKEFLNQQTERMLKKGENTPSDIVAQIRQTLRQTQ
jgi:DNA-binding response OmpR family regulator